MKSKIEKELYIPKIEVEDFGVKIEKVITELTGADKVEFATGLGEYNKEEVIIFDAVFYGDTEEEANQEYEKFKELVKESFEEEPKEM